MLHLSVIVPTRNEAAVAPLLISRLSETLVDVPCEDIFVDDSDDDTPEVIQHATAQAGLNVKIMHREGDARRGGLSTAAVEGVRAASGRYVCIMDADLHHPPE
ncbi:MAG TPA: glycosyltransferase, partial [Dehalococcoidia bacterium]|nr:glycosyltransferase [Dehalococcoidia bacterium]